MPRTIKSLFKLCRIFFYRNEFINNVITKLAEYPITDLDTENIEDGEMTNKYRELIDHHIRLKRLLIEIGLDYFTYGNSFISANMRFKRFLKCPKCNAVNPVERVKYTWQNYTFNGTCPSCKAQGLTFLVEDRYLKNPKYFKFIRWSPENITIDYDELTGDARYFYEMSPQQKRGIIEGRREVIERAPKLFIEAIRTNRKILLDPNNLYHFKRSTLAEEDQGWGKPLILAALPMLWYMQTLRRGNEAIASDHLVPMRTLFPSSQGNLDPFTQLNIGAWRSAVEENLGFWRRDPNHIGIFPIPIGYQSLGGDAKMLNVTQELRFLQEIIINSFGVPTEFISGGATWTSSSVSLRIVENHFLSYREELNDFLNYFAAVKISAFLDYPPTKFKMKKFRMSDDVQNKEALAQLAQMGKISDSYLKEEFGINLQEDRRYAEADNKFNLSLQAEQQQAQAEAQGKLLVIQAKYEARARAEAAEESARIRERLFETELIQEMQLHEQDPSDIMQKYTIQLAGALPKIQVAMLGELQQKAPLMFSFVVQRLRDMFGIIPGEENPEEQAKPAKTPAKKGSK